MEEISDRISFTSFLWTEHSEDLKRAQKKASVLRPEHYTTVMGTLGAGAAGDVK
jgi:hypothetical protein